MASSKLLRCGLLIIVLGATVFANLWPFDFQWPCRDCANGARFVEGPGAGIVFDSPGMVRDPEGGTLLHNALAGRREVTVVATVTSHRLLQRGPARIVSFSDGAALRNITLGQSNATLALRLRTPLTGPNGNDPQIEAPGAIRPGRRQVLVSTYDGAVFRMGAASGPTATPLAAGPLKDWDPGFALIFGNETTGDRPWLGRIEDVAIYDRSLGDAEIAAYLDPQVPVHLPGLIYRLADRCPATAPPERVGGDLRRGTCLLPVRYDNGYDWKILDLTLRPPSDYLLSALIWTPLGVLAFGLAAPRHAPPAVALTLLVLTVEMAQVLVYSRTSSAHDLLAAWIGIVLAAMLVRRLHRPA